MKKILLIAGWDPSGNAGLLRDLAVISHHRIPACAVITALTAQGRHRFFANHIVSAPFFKKQMQAVSPLSSYAAIKIGMLGNASIVGVLTRMLASYRGSIVLDPVYQSTTGGILLNSSGRRLLWEKLIPRVSLWTPNIEEASYFSKEEITSFSQMEQVGKILYQQKKIPLLIKGFKQQGRIHDLLVGKQTKVWFHFPIVKTLNIRGAGCRLSTLIALNLASGLDLVEAITSARREMQKWIQKEGKNIRSKYDSFF